MAVQDIREPNQLFQAAVGVDESTQELEGGLGWESVNGLFPSQYEVNALREQKEQEQGQGALQRVFGKKLIDANPNQQVYAIHQAYNGFGQYGYYVQTNEKIYFHQCESPKSMVMDFATLQTLGTDESGNSLDIFGHQLSNPAEPPDTSISCVFDFPAGDQPAPPNAGHPGVDFMLLTFAPVSPADARLRLRLISQDSGTPYDNYEIGFYKTQNACRQDSIPLVDGTDGAYLYPPTNAKYAYEAWGGPALINTWALSQTGPQPATPASWGQVSPPTKNQIYNDNFIQQTVNSPPNNPTTNTYYYSGVVTGVGQRIYDAVNRTIWRVTSITTFQQGSIPPGARIVNVEQLGYSIDYSNLPTSASNGQHAISGNIIYVYENGTWVKPYTVSFTATWTYATEAARAAATGFTSSNVGKYAFVTVNSAWYRLLAIDKPAVPVNVAWTYANQLARTSAIGFAASDIGKIAHQTNTNAYYTLTDFNNHTIKTDQSQTFLVNLNRLFTDYQQIAPASIQFLVRAFWDKQKNGAGVVNITAKSYKGGIVVRNDRIVWDISTGTLVNTQNTTKTCTLLSVDSDVRGNNLVLATLDMITGVINLTTPSVNGDGNTPCPF